MTAKHRVRITTSTGDQHTSVPADGTAAELTESFHRIFQGSDEHSTIGFKTADGSVALRTRTIETLELIDLPEEPEALADCGDEA